MKLKRRILWLIWAATAVLIVLAFIHIVVIASDVHPVRSGNRSRLRPEPSSSRDRVAGHRSSGA
jgi:hypothetical protein